MFATLNSFSQIVCNLGALSHNFMPTARNLGVLFDSGLCFDDQVKKVVQSCFFQFTLISKTKRDALILFIVGSDRRIKCSDVVAGIQHICIRSLKVSVGIA